MQQVVLTTLLIVANVLGVGMILPQIIRLHRTKSTSGVSMAWIGVGAVLNFWWTAYALIAGLWGVLPVSVGAALLHIAMAVQVVRLSGIGSLRGFFIGAAIFGFVPFPALALGGAEAAGVVIGLCYAVQFTPAALESFRSHDLRGLSFSTWIMAFGEAVIWAIYGVAETDAALIVGGSGGALASAVILMQLTRVRRPRTVVAT